MSLKDKRVKSFLFCIYCLTVIGTSAWASSQVVSLNQTEPNIVEYHAMSNQPVEIVSAAVAGKDIKFNESFVDNAAWMKNLSFTLKNKYNQPITYVELYLTFPETRATGNIMLSPLKFGKSKRSRVQLEDPEEFLLPGNEATLKFSLKKYSDMKDFLEKRHAITGLHKITIQVAEVQFADGTYWAGGSWFQIDPSDPKKIIRLNN